MISVSSVRFSASSRQPNPLKKVSLKQPRFTSGIRETKEDSPVKGDFPLSTSNIKIWFEEETTQEVINRYYKIASNSKLKQAYEDLNTLAKSLKINIFVEISDKWSTAQLILPKKDNLLMFKAEDFVCVTKNRSLFLRELAEYLQRILIKNSPQLNLQKGEAQ